MTILTYQESKLNMIGKEVILKSTFGNTIHKKSKFQKKLKIMSPLQSYNPKKNTHPIMTPEPQAQCNPNQQMPPKEWTKKSKSMNLRSQKKRKNQKP